MLIGVIADDLTGAADTGVQFVRAGYRTAVVFRATEVLADDLDAVSLDTDSRAMPAGFAAKRVLDAAHIARGASIVYKKLDSTLRGTSPQSSPRPWMGRIAGVPSSLPRFQPPGVPRSVASNASTAAPSTRPRWRMIPILPLGRPTSRACSLRRSHRSAH